MPELRKSRPAQDECCPPNLRLHWYAVLESGPHAGDSRARASSVRDLIKSITKNNRKIIEDLTEESTLPKSTPQKDVHWTSFFFVQIFHIKFCKKLTTRILSGII